MLEQKPGDQERQKGPSAVLQHRENGTAEREIRSVRLDGALDIPFFVQLVDPSLYRERIARQPLQPLLRVLFDLPVKRRAALRPGSSCRKHLVNPLK
jgi:hypothetical protein